MVSWIPKHKCICRQCVLSASMRLSEESVICKVAVHIRWTVNKFIVDSYKRAVKFCSFLYFDWNPVIHFFVTISVVFSWWLTVILSGFVYSVTLARSNVYSLVFWCLSGVNNCFCLWVKNCPLIPHHILVVSFLGVGNSRNCHGNLLYVSVARWRQSFKMLHEWRYQGIKRCFRKPKHTKELIKKDSNKYFDEKFREFWT